MHDASCSESSGPWGRTRRKIKRRKRTAHAQPQGDSDSSGPWGAPLKRRRSSSRSNGAWSRSSSDGPWSDSDPEAGTARASVAPGVMDAANLILPASGRVWRETTWAKNGRDRDRMRQVLSKDKHRHSSAKRKGPCTCESPCVEHVEYGTVVAACDAFWSMPPEALTVILHSMYSDATGGGQLSKVKWTMGNARVCFPMFAKLLGTSKDLITKYIKGEWMPRVHRGGRKRESSIIVDFFWASLYSSSAESLCRDTVEEKRIEEADADFMHDDVPWLNEGDWQTPVRLADLDWNPDRPPVELHAQLAALMSNPTSAADLGLPTRFLPHAPLMHYYWLFVSSWDSLQAHAEFVCNTSDVQSSGSSGTLPCPCYKTFSKRWNVVWRHYLKIRKSSQHSQCNTCFELQRRMHQYGASLAVRYQAALDLKQHYADQYADRCLYWSLRHASQMRENVLVIIIDAMDKTKFAWPRYPWARLAKSINFPRPRMVLTGAIAHGYCTSFFLASERLTHGADCFLEVLFTTIQQVATICTTNGWNMPEHLVIVSDNTVAQSKNSYVHLAAAYLVAIRQFKSVTMFYLMIGHTHEDIGWPSDNL